MEAPAGASLLLLVPRALHMHDTRQTKLEDLEQIAADLHAEYNADVSAAQQVGDTEMSAVGIHLGMALRARHVNPV